MSRPNNGPCLKKDKATGIFQIVWTDNHRSKRLSTRTANIQEAQKVLAGFLNEQEIDRERGDRWTLKQVLKYYEDNRVEPSVADKRRQQKAMAHIAAIIGDDALIDELSDADFTRYRAKRTAAGMKDATIRRELVALIAAINLAVKNRKLDNRHVPKIDLPPDSEPRDLFLTREQAAHLFKTAQGDAERLTKEYLFCAIALSTARRREAIESLKWFQVDLKARTIDFRRPGQAETKKRRGIAPISKWLLPILERAYKEKTSEWVLGYCGGRMTKPLAKMFGAAGMPEATPHTLRHTWGTWAAESGMSIWNIAGVMGCSVDTATKNYLHHSPAHLRAQADTISPDIEVSGIERIDGRNEADSAQAG